MRDPGLPLRLVGRPHLVPDHVGDDRSPTVRNDDDLEPIVEAEILDLLRRCRDVGDAGDQGNIHSGVPVGGCLIANAGKPNMGARRLMRKGKRVVHPYRRKRKGRVAILSQLLHTKRRPAPRTACRAPSSTTASAPGCSQPPSAERGERPRRQVAAVGWIEKGEREGPDRSPVAEPRRIASEQARPPAEPERVDIGSDEPARLGVLVDEDGRLRAARQRLEAERSRSREEIDHASARDGVAVAMHENIEERLPQPVRRRTDRLPLRRRQGPPAKFPPDDAHHSLSRKAK